jgi:hypothetical protein
MDCNWGQTGQQNFDHSALNTRRLNPARTGSGGNVFGTAFQTHCFGLAVTETLSVEVV